MHTIRILENTSNPTLVQKIARGILFSAVILGMITVIASTFSSMSPYTRLFAIFSYFLGGIFTVEYGLRLLDAITKGRKAARRYIFSFNGIIDFVSIMPFIMPYLFGIDPEVIFFINFSRVLLIFKLTRYSRAFNALGEVLSSVRTQLLISIMIPILFIFFSAILVYYVEHQAQPYAFKNIGDGLWWAVITMTTTGYGDIYPVTPLGKTFGGLTALIGVFIIALPTGIISSAFVSRLTQDKEHKEQIMTAGAYPEVTSNRSVGTHAYACHKCKMVNPNFNPQLKP